MQLDKLNEGKRTKLILRVCSVKWLLEWRSDDVWFDFGVSVRHSDMELSGQKRLISVVSLKLTRVPFTQENTLF